VRARALDGLHDATALQQIVQAHPPEQLFRAALDQLRQQVAGEQDDQRAEERGYELGELREAALQSLQKGHAEAPGRSCAAPTVAAENTTDVTSPINFAFPASHRRWRFDGTSGR
jgi:hypothetical protein